MGVSVTADYEPDESPEFSVPDAQAPLIKLTSLLSVPVSSVWPTEPHHFTPWLLDNSTLLSEVLGVDVELEAREHKVGPFSLDLIGKEVGSGRPVIIENQFGATDHGHLGQVLTYAGGTDPATVVWVAEAFREEHRAALDWLNLHTTSDVRFFGIRLGAVTLEGAQGGLVAPHLELVVKPNDWEKRARSAAADSSSPTATQLLYKQFWEGLEPELKSRHWTSGTAPAQNWWSMPTGVPTVTWGVSFAQFGCRSEIYFGHQDPSVNDHRWSDLKAHEDEIRQSFGPELLFDPLPNNKGCRVETRLLGPKISETNRWPEVRAWMIDTQTRLRAAVELVGGVPKS